MNWSIFATLVAQIEPPLMAAVNGMIAALSGNMAGVLKAGILVWLAGHMLVRVLNPGGHPLSEMESKVIRGGIGFVLATQAAEYHTYIRDVFLTGLPNGITALVSGAAGGQAISGAAFDAVWNKAWVGGLTVYQTLGTFEFGLQLMVVLYWIIALISIGAGFLIWMVSKLLLALFVGTGPLFVALFVFPATKGWFQGWLNGMLSSVVCQVFTVALLTILTAAENTIIAQIAGVGPGGAVQQLQLLLGGMLLFFICGLIVTQLPGAAVSIGGGVAFHAGAIGGAAFGAAGGVFSKMTSAAQGAVGGMAAAGQRASANVRAAGMSLSKSK